MKRSRLSTLMLLVVFAALGLALVVEYRRAARGNRASARVAEEDGWWRGIDVWLEATP
jgi:hypothetical protein